MPARALDHRAGQQVGLADEVGDVARGRPVVQVARGADLRDPPLPHEHDPVAHGERLLLIVRHVDEGDAQVGLQVLELELHLLPQLEIECAERLVQQQHPGAVDQRAGQRHPLLLPAARAGAATRAPSWSSFTISSACVTRSSRSAGGTPRIRRP